MPSALILAGGAGERFWPASTKIKPKQFLTLAGREPIIKETVQRIKGLIGFRKTYVVTTTAQMPLVCEILPELPPENIIVEPEGRNTAPCLVLSIAYIKKKEGKDEVIAVLPSDHYIGDSRIFQENLDLALRVAEVRKNIITFGIKPDRPETEYGYIAVGKEVETGVFQGQKFIEKPDFAGAQQYLSSGGYLWNSGIFVFQIEVFTNALRRYSPQLFIKYLEIEKAKDNDTIRIIYNQLCKVSIDYALMEKLPSFLVIPGTYGWDDLGTWRSLETIYPRDPDGNIIVGDGVFTDVSNCVVYSPEKPLAVNGVKDLVIAVSSDGVLICPKDRVKDVKEMVKKLETIQ